jgi:hypothetical protein
MENLLWNRNEFNQIYNCTDINVDDIPFEQRRYPITAIICIILGFIYYVKIIFFIFLNIFLF